MTAAAEIVREHIAAFTRFDWATLEGTVSESVRLQLVGIVDWEWKLPTLYRHVSQAWDFTPEDVHLHDAGDGAVRVQLRLTNGAGLAKEIMGEYHVTGERIDAITLTDQQPVRAGS